MARLLNSAVLVAVLVWAVMQARSAVKAKRYRLLVLMGALFIAGVATCLDHASEFEVMVLTALGTAAYIAVELRGRWS